MIGARCVRLDIRSVILIILCFFFNGIKYSNTGELSVVLLFVCLWLFWWIHGKYGM